MLQGGEEGGGAEDPGGGGEAEEGEGEGEGEGEERCPLLFTNYKRHL